MVGMAPTAVLHDSTLRMVLDYAGVAVFGATGALAAARRGFDIVTFAFFAAVTGIGGGTLRDLLLGAPVFWVAQPGYVGMCIASAGVVWALGERLSRFRSLLWLDALGLAAYCVVGASKAADYGAPPLVAVVMGVLSASFGGVVRDVLAGEPSVLLRKEIYVTAALLGASVFVLMRLVGAPDPLAGGLGMAAAFALRAGALTRGWTLPGFKAGEAETTPAGIWGDPAPKPEAGNEPEPALARPAEVAPVEASPPKRRAARKPRPKTEAGSEAAPARPRPPGRPKDVEGAGEA